MKTHFADDMTLAHIAKLEAEIEQLECELKLTYAAVEKLKSENEALREELEPLRRDYTASIQRMGDLELEIEGEVKENMALRARLDEAISIMDSLRDYVCEGGALGMIGATQCVNEADQFIDAARKP